MGRIFPRRAKGENLSTFHICIDLNNWLNILLTKISKQMQKGSKKTNTQNFYHSISLKGGFINIQVMAFSKYRIMNMLSLVAWKTNKNESFIITKMLVWKELNLIYSWNVDFTFIIFLVVSSSLFLFIINTKEWYAYL